MNEVEKPDSPWNLAPTSLVRAQAVKKVLVGYEVMDIRHHHAILAGRSDQELNHALQILDRYLRDECAMRTNRRMECLGDILRRATSLQDDPASVIERVRVRLKDAQEKTPLDDFDYVWAIGREPEGWEPMPLYITIPVPSGASKAEATVTRKRLKEPRKRG